MAEAELLWGWDIIVVSQLFNTNDLTGMLDSAENDRLAGRLQQYPLLRHKLRLLAAQLRSNNFLDKTSVGVTTLALLFRKDQTISQKYKKKFLDTICMQKWALLLPLALGRGMTSMFLSGKHL
jgi:hypothetical protein